MGGRATSYLLGIPDDPDPHSATKETPFSLAYGSKVIVLVEIGEPTLGILAYEGASNQQTLTTTITFFGIKA